MENKFVANLFQDIEDNVLLQLFLETSIVMDGELVLTSLPTGNDK